MTDTTEITPTVLQRVRRQKRWAAAAWHQAGHAVARIALGYAVRRVRLTPGHPTRDGRCEYRVGPGNLAAVVGLLAGGEARVMVTGHRRDLRAGEDYREAARLAAAAAGSPAEADGLMRRLRWEAEDLVVANRRAVAGVAAALLASDTLTLTGREVKAIVEATGGSG
jgi:hypothetical protein